MNSFIHFLTKNNILHSYQSGFRAGHSTTTAAMAVVNNIVTGLDRKKHCAALFFDLSKAFDTVDHNLHLDKLAMLGFDNASLKWFQDYLSNWT